MKADRVQQLEENMIKIHKVPICYISTNHKIQVPKMPNQIPVFQIWKHSIITLGILGKDLCILASISQHININKIIKVFKLRKMETSISRRPITAMLEIIVKILIRWTEVKIKIIVVIMS